MSCESLFKSQIKNDLWTLYDFMKKGDIDKESVNQKIYEKLPNLEHCMMYKNYNN